MVLTNMKGKILWLIYCVLILPPPCLQSDIFDDENIRQNLAYLCPGVEICSTDAPVPKHKHVDSNGYMSCCHGCSCHEACHLSLTCCFPKKTSITSPVDYSNGTVVGAGLNREEEQLVTESDGKSTLLPLLMKDRRGGTRQTTPTATETMLTTMASRDITTPYGDDLSRMQCRYASTGDQAEYRMGYEAAFRMVTRPPLGGCKPNPECQTLVSQNIEATCDDDVSFPWGEDLYPVYSSARQLIFKNERCACCHGVSEYKHWTALVVCDLFDQNVPRDVSIAAHFNFLHATNNMSSEHCYLTFSFVDINVLLQHMCYMDTIDTCINWTDTSPLDVPKGVNMTQSEIAESCQNGPNAPFVIAPVIFKNVFCAMCNMHMNVNSLQCLADVSVNAGKSFGPGKFSYILDAVFMQSYPPGGENQTPVPSPTACLKNDSQWIEESCRSAECPAGQVQNAKGLCTFPSTRWLNGVYEVAVELKYVNYDESVLTMLNSSLVTLKDVDDAFTKSNPWPSRWTILTIHHSTREYPFPPRIAVFLKVHTSQPKTLVAQITASMKLKWNVLLNGNYIVFSQSFLKYNLLRGFNTPQPSVWTLSNEDMPFNVPDSEDVHWLQILDRLVSLVKTPILLNKLFTCEQTALLEDEYISTSSTMVLLNKLTNKVMFDQEFDILDIKGKLVPRVCLSDTTLVLRRGQNVAPTLQLSTITKILYITVFLMLFFPLHDK